MSKRKAPVPLTYPEHLTDAQRDILEKCTSESARKVLLELFERAYGR